MKIEVCKHKCDQCLFSKNRIVSVERMQEILNQCKENNDHFLCHKGTLKDKKVVCAGFYESRPTTLLQLARRFNLLEFINPKKI